MDKGRYSALYSGNYFNPISSGDIFCDSNIQVNLRNQKDLNKIKWLCDNAMRMGENNSIIKENYKKMIESYMKTNYNDLDSMYKIENENFQKNYFVALQMVMWSYTNNITPLEQYEPTYEPRKTLYKMYKEEAEKNGDYNRNEAVSVYIDNSKATYNNGYIGPFIIDNKYELPIELKVEGDGIESKCYKSDKTEIPMGEKYKGEVYLKANNQFAAGNTAKLTVNTYNTVAMYYLLPVQSGHTSNPQPLLFLDRYAVSANSSYTYEPGKYEIKIKKYKNEIAPENVRSATYNVNVNGEEINPVTTYSSDKWINISDDMYIDRISKPNGDAIVITEQDVKDKSVIVDSTPLTIKVNYKKDENKIDSFSATYNGNTKTFSKGDTSEVGKYTLHWGGDDDTPSIEVQMVNESVNEMTVELVKESAAGLSVTNTEFSIRSADGNVDAPYNSSIGTMYTYGKTDPIKLEVNRGTGYNIDIKETTSIEPHKNFINNGNGYLRVHFDVGSDGNISLNKLDGNNYTVKGGSLTDGSKVSVNYNPNDRKITITITDPLCDIGLQIKKVSKENEEDNVSGVKFKVYYGDTLKNALATNNGKETNFIAEETTNNDGTIQLNLKEKLQGNLDNLIGKNLYITESTTVPGFGNSLYNSSNEKYNYIKIPIKYDGKKGNIDIGTYSLVDNQETVINLGKDVTAFKLSGGNLIYVSVKNPKKTIKLKIHKENNEKQDLSGAVFNVYADVNKTKKIAEGLSTNQNGEIELDISDKIFVDGNRYLYIEEQQAPAGYENGLKDSFVKVSINIDEKSGKVALDNSNGYVVDKSGKSITNSNVDEPTISQNNDCINLNIKNPRSKTSVDLYLNKHIVNGNENIAGAEFSVTQYDSNKTKRKDLPTVTSGTDDVKFDTINEIEIGKSYVYYYDIIETKAPDGYSIPDVSGARVKVSIDEKGKISNISIDSVYYNKNWINPANVNGYGKYVSVSNAGKALFTMSNTKEFTFTLHKRNLGEDLEKPSKFDGKAEFEIVEGDRIIPISVTADNYDNLFDTKTGVGANQKYTYTITEKSVSDTYCQTLVNKSIAVEIRTDENGNVCKVDNNGKWSTQWKFTDSNNEQYNNFVMLEVKDNNVDIYIYNQPINSYSIKLFKIDENKKTIEDYDAEFRITKLYSMVDRVLSYRDVKTNKGIAAVDGLSNNGTILKHRYRITELVAPVGYEKIEGEISLDIDFDQSGKIINKTIKYIENNEEKNSVVTSDFNENEQALSIYIENKKIDSYKFNLRKKDTNGNPIKPESTNNYTYNGGAGFKVDLESVKFTSDGESYYRNKGYNPDDIKNSALEGNKNVIDGILDGECSDSRNLYGNMIYTYRIEEKCSKIGYDNILKDKYILLNIQTKIENEKPVIDYQNSNYKVYDINNNDITNSFNQEYGTFKIIPESNNNEISFEIINPSIFKVRLNKTDMNGNSVNAKLHANVGTTEIVNTLDENAQMSSTGISKNYISYKNDNKQTIKVYEDSVQSPYKNMFKDKHIEVNVQLNKNGEHYVESKSVKNNDGSPNNSLNEYVGECKFVEENGEKVLSITLKNPISYNLNLIKYENDEKTECKGATLSIDDKEVIKDGTSSYQKAEIQNNSNGTRIYTIREVNPAPNHINILQGKYIKLQVNYSSAGISYSHEIYNDDNTKVDVSDNVYKYVEIAKTKDENNVDVILVKIMNPTEFKFELTKEDAIYGTKLGGVSFDIKRSKLLDNGGNEIKNSVSKETSNNDSDKGTITFTENDVEPGIYEYCISEIVGLKGYENVFNADGNKYVYVKIKVDEKYKVSIEPYGNGNKFEIRQSDGAIINPSNQIYNYVDGVKFENGTLKVTIKNPRKYQVKIHKSVYGNEDINLKGTTFEITKPNGDTKSFVTDDNGDILLDEVTDTNQKYTYKIKEISSGSDKIINALGDNTIEVTIKVNEKGKVEIVPDQKGNKYTIKSTSLYNKNSINEFFNVRCNNSTLDVSVSNPQKYDIIVQKKNATKKRWLNDVDFDISSEYVNAKKENSKYILKGTDFVDKATTYTTATVNGQDGVIKIDNILIEKAGTYYLTLRENLPKDSNFKKIDDIKIKYTIVADVNGYRIGDYEIVSGNASVDMKESGIINDSEVKTTVNNTEITGHYTLALDKLEKNTTNRPSGCEFKITAKDSSGNSKTLYEYDGKENNKEIIGKDGKIIITDGSVKSLDINIDKAEKYTIIIEETKVPNDEYYIIEKAIEIPVETVSDGNRYYLKNGNNINDEHYSVSFDKDSCIINVEAYNEPVEGEYGLKILKKSKNTDEPLKDILFNITYTNIENNNREKVATYNTITNDKGYAYVSGNSYNYELEDTDAANMVKITKSNKDVVDEYVINEVRDINTTGYDILHDPITVKVYKEFNKELRKYEISKLDITATSSSGGKTTTISKDQLSRENIFKARTSSCGDVNLSVKVDSLGMIQVTVENPVLFGKYDLKLKKVLLDSQNIKSSLLTATFAVKKTGEESKQYLSENGGYTKAIESSISSNDEETDEYEISEISVTNTDGVVKMKDTLKLTVKKQIVDNKARVTKFKLYNITKNSRTREVTVIDGENYTENLIIELEDGRFANATIEMDSNFHFTITIENKKPTGELSVYVKKVDEITNNPINDTKFSGTKSNNNTFEVTTANNEAVLIEKVQNLNSASKYEYIINEVEVPGSYLKITDYKLKLSFETKLNNDKTKYIINQDTIKIEPIANGNNSPTKATQLDVLRNATFNSTDNSITIIYPNRPVTDLDLSLIKVNMLTDDGTDNVENAKFTIKENGVTILENKTLKELPEGALNKKNVPVGSKFVYEIYEDEAAPGFKNLLKTDNYLAHLKVTIEVIKDENGIITTTGDYRIVVDEPKSEGQVKAYNDIDGVLNGYKTAVKANKKIDREILEKNNNSYILYIPNPYLTSDINVNLNKFVAGTEKSSTGMQGVSGAEFTIKKICTGKENRVDITAIIAKFNDGSDSDVQTLNKLTTEKGVKTKSIDKLEKVKAGESYYYELTESNVPTNYNTKFKKAIVRIHLDANCKVIADLLAVIPNNANDWVLYGNSNAKNDIYTKIEDNTVNIFWSNNVEYTLRILKKGFENSISKSQDWSALRPTPNAMFTITKIKPDIETILNNSNINDFKVILNNEADAGQEYTYKIVENAAQSGYYNLFEGMYFTLRVKVQEDGKINRTATRLVLQQGTASDDAYYLARNLYKLEIKENNGKEEVLIYIANKQITNTYGFKILKVGDKKINNELVGIKGVEFSIRGPGNTALKDPNTNKNYVTDDDGIISISGRKLSGGIDHYILKEELVPDGVTKLENTDIIIDVDTNGISETDTVEEIQNKLKEIDPTTGKLKRIKLQVSRTGAGGLSSIEGLEINMKGNDIVIKVPNNSSDYSFNIFKNDLEGNRIIGEDGIDGASFTIQDDSGKNDELILDDGTYTDTKIAEPNHSYVYYITEKRAKKGFENILEGWKLQVTLNTDSNGLIKTTENNGLGGYSYFELLKIQNKEATYSAEEVLKHIKMETIVDSINRTSTINLTIENPDSYRVKLVKKDIDGISEVNKASISADRLDKTDEYDAKALFSTKNEERRISILQDMVGIGTNESVQSNRKSEFISNLKYKIERNISEEMDNETSQTWRIKENDVDAPYYNPLKDKFIIVTTYFKDNELKIANHKYNDDKEYSFFITDKNGNDYTQEHEKYIEVITEKINGEWTVVVTIKDPMIFYVGLNKIHKKADYSSGLLKGAKLTLTCDKETVTTDGKSSTDKIRKELPIGSTMSFSFTEESSIAGHVNILKDRRVACTVANQNGTLKIISTNVINTTNGQPVDDNEKQKIMNYITIDSIKNNDGYTEFVIDVENPIEYKFNLKKFKVDNTPLEGTSFYVYSSHSGTHLLYNDASMEFTENNVMIGEEITYKVKELSTVENSAYVNVHDQYTYITVKVKDNGLIEIKNKQIETKNGKQDIDNVEYADFRITDPDSNGIQTVCFEFKNPVQYNVELEKISAGENPIKIKGAKFNIEKVNSNQSYPEYTDDYGAINFSESPVNPGNYEYKITEVETADKNYENILDGVYIKVFIKVGADGTVEFDSDKLGNTRYKYKIYSNNNEQEVDDIDLIKRIHKYIPVDAVYIDNSNPVNTVKIVVKNPVKFTFGLNKVNAEGKSLPGATFSIISEISGNHVNTSDENGHISFDENYVCPGIYKYVISETEAPSNKYFNILKDYNIAVYVKVAEDGTLSYIKDKNGTLFDEDEEYKYFIEDKQGNPIDNSTRNQDEIVNPIHKNITFSEPIKKANDKDEISAKVVNNVNFKLDIVKVDKDTKEFLNGAQFTVYEEGTLKLLNKDITDQIELLNENVKPGYYEYYITENNTEPNHINILSGKYIKVEIYISENGYLTIAPFFIYEGNIQYRKNSKLLDRETYSDLYSMIKFSKATDDDISVMKVTVENPVRKIKLKINKTILGNERINLKGTKFNIYEVKDKENIILAENIESDKDGNIEYNVNKIEAGKHIYKIKEVSAPSKDIINKLENMYIVAEVNVDENGKISTKHKYHSIADSIDLEDNEGNIINDENVEKLVTVYCNNYTDDGISVFEVYVKDPQFYNLRFIKKDKDTKEPMKNVTFNMTVKDENDNSVELLDVNTFNKINTDNVISKEDGTYEITTDENGVISIPNVLIQKKGNLVFELEEMPVNTEQFDQDKLETGSLGYNYKTCKENIKFSISIGTRSSGEFTKYVVANPQIISGGDYIERLNLPLPVPETIKSIQQAEIYIHNERAKGFYNLVLNKVDSYRENTNLNGAEFDIKVLKDGNEYVLYEYTDDVTSKNKKIPDHFVVENGKLEIPNIRIDRKENYTIILTETKAPDGYMLLDDDIILNVVTTIEGNKGEEKYVLKTVELNNEDNHNLVSCTSDKENITVKAKNEYFDLSLRKSITSISYEDDTNDGEITEDDTLDRIPDVVTDKLFENKETTATYNHNKKPVRAYASQYVIYTLRVYNEGEIDGYAEEITDHLPEELEYVDDKFNADRLWSYDPETRSVKTNYLSQEVDAENNVIKAMNKETGELDFKEIQIKCKIPDNAPRNKIITNIAEISVSKAKDRKKDTKDRDSVTNNVNVPENTNDMSEYKNDELEKSYVPGQEDDDDFEKIYIDEFDLSLRKYIVAVNDEELLLDENDEDKDVYGIKYEREPRVNVSALKDGTSTTASYTHTKDPVEVSVGDVVTYTIQVYNEGTVSGYASLIKDDIPEGVEFVQYEPGDGSVNDTYRWKMVDENDNEVTDPSKAKYIVSDYLSKANEKEDGEFLLNAYDYESDKLDSKYVRAQFRVICKQDYPKIITNYAQISEDSDEKGGSIKDRDSTPNKWLEEDDEDIENLIVTYMDLALRKFITQVGEKAVDSRIPQVDATALIDETGTTAKYEHPKDPLLVHTSDIVIYTLRVYNEGSKNGYATQIKDDIPEGLQFVADHNINKYYGWKLVDGNDQEVNDPSKAKYIVSNYLSKDNETEDGQFMIKGFNKETMTTPDYKEVKIAFKVIEPTTSDRIITNYAQISKQTDGDGIERKDRDSTPNKWLEEDDEDIEKIRVQYFDLALRKWVTHAYVTENGQTKIIETGHKAEDDPENIVKVDIKKSKIDNVEIKFKYSIRITNQGEIPGEATEISDYIPQGLKFVQSDNPDWKEVDGKVVTDKLAGTTLQPGESADVEILLTWINSKDNLGVMINTAEISKDHNKYETPDIDSKPNNKKKGEDDIDDAPVMITLKTGSEGISYVAVSLGFVAIISAGAYVIKRKMLI